MGTFKQMDYKDTYCEPDAGNVRYPSSAAGAENGWAYIFTKDAGYVYDLSQYHKVQVRKNGIWIPYAGDLPDEDDHPSSPEDVVDDEGDHDPNY